MEQKKLFKPIVFLMVFMFMANYVATKLHWYYSIFWFDMLMHFLGGVWVGLFFLYVFNGKSTVFKKFLVIISLVLLVGLLWEVFEFIMGIIAHDSFNIVDTTSDLFFDFLGGSAAVLLFFDQIMPAPENKV